MDDPPRFDIVIVGAGPVGLLLSTYLARWGYKIKHVDNRAEPTRAGRADGIQPRALDLFKNMDLKTRLLSFEPARLYEVAFWNPTPNGIQRSGTWASCPKFIDARYPFTVLLHQGLIERVFIEDLERNGTHIQRPWTVFDFKNNSKDRDYPVEVRLGRVDGEIASETVKAKYLFGGEGGKSFVRQKLGIQMHHKDPIAYVWGVMDGVVQTNFPDIRLKCTVHSDSGSVMVIPRESNMVRLYIQLASSSDADFNPRKWVSAKEVQETAKRILRPYELEWETVDWYSVYPIGQGIAEKYTLDERVFIGGDACHTHSPKAGQGMNTAFLDAQNLAWKIHHVESGFCSRSILSTYESERRHIAESLLNFDAKFAKLFSQRQPSPKDSSEANDYHHNGKEESLFIKTLKENSEFTSGYGVAYQPNLLNRAPSHQDAAYSPHFLSYPEDTHLRTGRIFIPSTVSRVRDANVVPLEQEIPSNGSFRIFVFCGLQNVPTPRPQKPMTVLNDFATHASRRNSFLTAFLRPDLARVSPHEKHNPHSFFVTFATIFAAKRAEIELDEATPPLLARYRQHVYADDVEDLRVLGAPAAAHAKMGLEQGGVVVVRPDGYVGCVIRLSEGSGTIDALNEYFEAFVGRTLGPKTEESPRDDLLARL